MAVAPGPGGLLWRARHGVHVGVGLEVAHGDDLLSLPYLESEGAGPWRRTAKGPS